MTIHFAHWNLAHNHLIASGFRDLATRPGYYHLDNLRAIIQTTPTTHVAVLIYTI